MSFTSSVTVISHGSNLSFFPFQTPTPRGPPAKWPFPSGCPSIRPPESPEGTTTWDASRRRSPACSPFPPCCRGREPVYHPPPTPYKIGTSLVVGDAFALNLSRLSLIPPLHPYRRHLVEDELHRVLTARRVVVEALQRRSDGATLEQL